MATTDAIEYNVYALTGEAVNFFHEVEMPVIDGDTGQIGNDRRPSR